jgi:hypothetical protein
MSAMTGRDAVGFIEKHGLVLQSAHVAGVPTLVEFIAAEKIKGSWWGHPKGKEIFRVLGEVYDSKDVVALRLVRGKLTLAHRRVWPALVALAGEIGEGRLAAVKEQHTATGKHVSVAVPFPKWVPRDVLAAGRRMDLAEARRLCAPALAE